MSLMWSMDDLRQTIQQRTHNKFDCNIAISRQRRNGKSTLAFKLLSKMKGFRPWKHQVYARPDVMKLLESQKFSFIFDDEAINSSYKRSFYEQEQQRLIRMLNMYRDNFNIYCIAIPNFYSLDRDIRNLVAIHLQVISRGMAIIHIANTGQLYSDDPWDVAYNKKIEDKWAKRMKKDPKFTPPYQKLTTFKGYLKFGDLNPKQRMLYEEIKAVKRKALYLQQREEEEKSDPVKRAFKTIVQALIDGKVSSMETMQQTAYFMGVPWKNFIDRVNTDLKDMGIKETMSYFIETKGGKSPNLSFLGLKRGKNDYTSKELFGSPNNSKSTEIIKNFSPNSWISQLTTPPSSNSDYLNSNQTPEIPQNNLENFDVAIDKGMSNENKAPLNEQNADPNSPESHINKEDLDAEALGVDGKEDENDYD